MKTILRVLPFLAALTLAAIPAHAELRTEAPRSASSHVSTHVTAPQDLASTTLYVSAQAMAGYVAGTTKAVTAANPSVGGRNVTITVDDFDNGGELVVTWRVDGTDQFGKPVSETFTTTGDSAAATAEGEGVKIFAKVTLVTVISITGLEASDAFSLGTGDKVGLTRMFSSDFREIVQASLIAVNGTTIAAVTISSDNFDSTYFAVKAAAFSASTVDDGDRVALLLVTDTNTPDNRDFPVR